MQSVTLDKLEREQRKRREKLDKLARERDDLDTRIAKLRNAMADDERKIEQHRARKRKGGKHHA